MMSTRRRLRRLLRVLFHKDRVEQEMNEELRFHMDMETEDRIQTGMNPDEARREARVRFGAVEGVREEVRMARGGRLIEDLFADAKLALRGLRRTPGFTAVALSMLALGIGANTAIFSVIQAVLLKPLPFQEPNELVQVYETHVAQGWDRFPVSHPNLADLMEMSTSFDGVAATVGPYSGVLGGEGRPERVTLRAVTPGFYRILGVTPVLGRTFEELDAPSAPSSFTEAFASTVVLLGEDAWVNRFGADPEIIGRTVLISGTAQEVVGVLPRDGPWLREEVLRAHGTQFRD